MNRIDVVEEAINNLPLPKTPPPPPPPQDISKELQQQRDLCVQMNLSIGEMAKSVDKVIPLLTSLCHNGCLCTFAENVGAIKSLLSSRTRACSCNPTIEQNIGSLKSVLERSKSRSRTTTVRSRADLQEPSTYGGVDRYASESHIERSSLELSGGRRRPDFERSSPPRMSYVNMDARSPTRTTYMKTERGTQIEHHTSDLRPPLSQPPASEHGFRSGSISLNQSPGGEEHHRASYLGPQIQPLTLDIGLQTRNLSEGPCSAPTSSSTNSDLKGWTDFSVIGQQSDTPTAHYRPSKRTGRRKLLLKKRSSSTADVDDTVNSSLLSYVDITDEN